MARILVSTLQPDMGRRIAIRGVGQEVQQLLVYSWRVIQVQVDMLWRLMNYAMLGRRLSRFNEQEPCLLAGKTMPFAVLVQA
jgi:hypothetical protein